jgi:hypothetical protein
MSNLCEWHECTSRHRKTSNKYSILLHEVTCILQVCLGDRIIIDLKNNIAGGELSIHWHGVFQKGTQYMDGVPMVTQCSIREGNVFRYDFNASNEGTHYWHSHDGMYRRSCVFWNKVLRRRGREIVKCVM